MTNGRSNGSAGGGRANGHVGTAGGKRSGPEEADRIWRHLRAYLDTLCETGRAVDRVPGRADGGLDKGRALNLWADRAEEAIEQLTLSVALARAQAIDEARGRDFVPPVEEEASETRRAREARTPDSSSGRKR